MTGRNRWVRSVAVGPGIVFSVLLVLVVGESVPQTPGVLVDAGYVLAALSACPHRTEGRWVRMLGRARRPTAVEAALLGVAARRVVACGLPPARMYVARRDAGRGTAEPWGRASVVIAPWVLRSVRRGQLDPEVLVAHLAHASAGLQTGPAGSDLVTRVLTVPGALTMAAFHRLAATSLVVPGARTVWHLRAVVGAVAVGQCLQAGQVTIAVTAGLLPTLSYLSPACSRSWQRRMQTDSDRLVASRGLGQQLASAVRACGGPGGDERALRILRAAHPANGQDRDRPPSTGGPPERPRLYVVR